MGRCGDQTLHVHRGDELGKGAKLGIASDDRWGAFIIAIIENAANANIIIRLLLERADQRFSVRATTDDYGATLHDTVSCPAADAP